MNKDVDQRLVPKGEYRDAMNIQVSTSEGSDVGTAQNILGNREIAGEFDISALGGVVVASVADEKNDTLYWLVWSDEIDYIFSYKRDDSIETVFRDFKTRVDTNGNLIPSVLKFDKSKSITGINIIDDMLFWTDGVTEPKKINIPRSVIGTLPAGDTRTSLMVNNTNMGSVKEEHITVIKKSPQNINYSSSSSSPTSRVTPPHQQGASSSSAEVPEAHLPPAPRH